MVGQLIQVLTGKSYAYSNRQTLPKRARGHIYPGNDWGWMAFQTAAKLAQRQQFFVSNGTRGFVHGVQQRRGVALGEDKVVIVGILRVVKVVMQVARHQDS